jgi:hypothetical protein
VRALRHARGPVGAGCNITVKRRREHPGSDTEHQMQHAHPAHPIQLTELRHQLRQALTRPGTWKQVPALLDALDALQNGPVPRGRATLWVDGFADRAFSAWACGPGSEVQGQRQPERA